MNDVPRNIQRHQSAQPLDIPNSPYTLRSCSNNPNYYQMESSPTPSSPALSAIALRRQRPARSKSASTSSASVPQFDHDAATLRSNHISIVSLDDDYDEDGNCSSSIVDSDSDLDNLSMNLSAMGAAGAANPFASASGPTIRSNGMIVINNGTPTEVASSSVMGSLPNSNQRPNIGSIALQNSTDITFGDKTFYQGPVTVKQFFLEKDQWRRQESQVGSINGGTVPTVLAAATPSASGVRAFDNGSFVSASDEDGSRRNRDGGTREAFIDTPMTQHLNSTPNDTPKKNGRYWWSKLKRLRTTRPLALSTYILMFLLFVSLLTFIVYLLLVPISQHSNELPQGDDDETRLNWPDNSSLVDEHINTEFGSSVPYIARLQWLAQPPRHPLVDLNLPATRVIITHTASARCETIGSCTYNVRYIQTFHMDSNNWNDIGYNFLIGGDGMVYIGRGWDKVGAHTRGFNSGSIGIAFIGTFIDEPPPVRQLRIGQMLLAEGVQDGYLRADYKLYGHRQLVSTESPGEAFYRVLQTWPHWVNSSRF